MKLSKIISLLLVPLLLFALALPAYADGGSESYLIYFETGGGTGVLAPPTAWWCQEETFFSSVEPTIL